MHLSQLVGTLLFACRVYSLDSDQNNISSSYRLGERAPSATFKTVTKTGSDGRLTALTETLIPYTTIKFLGQSVTLFHTESQSKPTISSLPPGAILTTLTTKGANGQPTTLTKTLISKSATSSATLVSKTATSSAGKVTTSPSSKPLSTSATAPRSSSVSTSKEHSRL